MIVIFISECEQNALKKTRQVLDAFANRIGHRTWKTVITDEGLKAVKKLLSKTASRSSAVACHWIRSHTHTELMWIVGNRSKFNSQGFVPVNTTQQEIVNTKWENDWHYLPLIKSLSALAGLFHDFGKSSLCFQEKLKRAVDSTKSGKTLGDSGKTLGNSGRNLGDPLRHEWISILILKEFVTQSNPINDQNWLGRLASGGINDDLFKQASENINKFTSDIKPLENLPNAAALISWLILSHHKMPLVEIRKTPNANHDLRYVKAQSLSEILSKITQDWGYQNRAYADESNQAEQKKYEAQLKKCFEFQEGLPSQSDQWQKHIKRWSAKMVESLPLLEKAINDGSWRLILHHARLSLMIGDHFYSSQDRDPKWYSDLKLFANTKIEYIETRKKRITQQRNVKKSGQLYEKSVEMKQKLDEHLVGVMQNALKFAQMLPFFESELRSAEDIKALKKRSSSDSKYKWQDKAVDKIKKWQEESLESNKYGFFVVNMASTGCGKTLANAKVMQALSKDGESLRYILALGLRTLTLQTGDEYRERIHLDETELAVVIGSKAIKELHEQKEALTCQTTQPRSNHPYNKDSGQSHYLDDYVDDYEQAGSESRRSLLDEDVHYEGDIPVNNLSTILTSENHIKFLYAPVLVCTIDHIMAATETKRGGHYMLPSLRLLSSDLVIDEVDDFNGNDLIAIGRLIHLAGMSGCKVMISSATIPPDLAEGYFNAYKEGWNIYSKTRDASSVIGCCWIDEFNTKVESVIGNNSVVGNSRASLEEKNQPFCSLNSEYQELHQAFINKRIAKLKKEPVKRKANIVDCQEIVLNRELTIEQAYFEKIKDAIIKKHLQHNTKYTPHSNKNNNPHKTISFGVVRVAHIKTCISLAKYLIESEWHENFDPKIMAYHSRQVLLLRSEQEKHLDQILKRKEREGQKPAAFENKIIRSHIENSSAENIIFILVATPVEEVGRDHDFDWAVVEPSSYRSIIQLAGRVMRHRDQQTLGLDNLNNNLKEPNIALMQYNLKALEFAIQNIDSAAKGRKTYKGSTTEPAYCKPGYEGVIQEGGITFNLATHDLKELLDENAINQKIDAVPRIWRNKDLNELINLASRDLASLEHYVIHNLLTMYDKVGPESMQGWLTQNWWLTAIPQSLTRFRAGRPEVKLHLVYEESDPLYSELHSDSIKPKFMEKNNKGNYSSVEQLYRINHENIDQNFKNRLWLERDYLSLLQAIEYERGIPIRTASIRYGEISFPDYGYNNRQQQYVYSDQFGLQEM
ncbi:MAG: type I-F CRISPR-associated helicase Cas3 [Desulfamplus sp.]|nr:type I-F CRISPR-associated helicase Cas3 [Desulfamplus sp.]